ncbi:MAG: hypothetical protein RMJ44_02640 [Cytophagales bacterium]|nr:hypothetical protein [Bernardetiaceae bacterium]MDW8209960.1 hypothetical protein [Cytophagales bacterium]
MKTNKIFNILLISFASLSISCHKEVQPEFDPSKRGFILLEFDNVVGTRDLELNRGVYRNAAGEDFTVTQLLYYVSNIRLKKADGTEYVVPQDSSYFLVREHVPDTHVIRLSVPQGDYIGVSFILGVDSLRSTMDISRRQGVLNPTDMTREEGMYWTWNSGYIFLRLEGTSPQIAPDPAGNRRFRYHIGGFGGGFGNPPVRTINNIKKIELSFKRDVAKVRSKSTPQMHIIADVLKVFNGPNTISLAQNPTVMFSPFSVNVANNYQHMFEYHHMHTVASR